MEKCYAVIYVDYEEYTTKYICATKEIADAVANTLNRYECVFDIVGSVRDKSELPRYEVREYDVLTQYIEPDFPKYVRVTVEFNPDGKTWDEMLKFIYPRELNECHYKSEPLPDFAKDVDILISTNKTDDRNDLEFGIHLPMYKDDNRDTITARGMKVIRDAIDQMKEKGYYVDMMLRGDVTKFDKNLWKIHEYGGGGDGWRMAVATIPNPLMANVNLENGEIGDKPTDDN